MKRTLSLLLSLALVLTLAACGASADPAPEGDASASAAPEALPTNQPEAGVLPEDGTLEEVDGGGKKILIAYFSATNNTENIANHLNEILDADIYKITPETPYTSADLDYNTDCRANREQDDASARPAISGSVDDMGQYDVIFLGYPRRIVSYWLISSTWVDSSGRSWAFCASCA